MKDTVHHPVHLSVHSSTPGSVPIRRTCALWSTQFGRGQTTVLGWNDPGFGRDSAPNGIRGVVPAQQQERGPLTKCCPLESPDSLQNTPKNKVNSVKTVRITDCNFLFTPPFTRSLARGLALNDLEQTAQRKSPRKTHQNGWERPRRWTHRTSRCTWGRSRRSYWERRLRIERVNELYRAIRMRRRIQLVRQDCTLKGDDYCHS